MALLCGWAGRLPDAVSVEAEASFPPPPGFSRFKWALEEAPVKQQLMQRLRMWRIAKHDWAASIDALMHDCPRLAALAKLLLGPRTGLTSLDSLLHHETIKPVARDVLETSRKTRQGWQAAITAASKAVPQVEAALAAVHLQQHHQQQQQLGVAAPPPAAAPEQADTARSVVRCRVDTGKLQPLMLGDKLWLLHEQYKQQQLEEYKQQRAEAEAAAAASCCRTEGGVEHALGSSSTSSEDAATPIVAGCPDHEPAAPQQSPPQLVRAEDPALELEILRDRLRATQARLAGRDSDVERLQLLVQGLQRSIVSLQNLDSRAWRQQQEQEQQEQGQQQGRTSVPGTQAAAAGLPAQAAAEPAAAPRPPAAGVHKAVWRSLPGGGWGFVAVVVAMCVLWAHSGKQNKFR
jgi:hypothetical protein